MRAYVDEVLAVQAERARAYHELARALDERDECAIESTTEAFRELSGRIRAVIDACESKSSHTSQSSHSSHSSQSSSYSRLVELLRKMQEDEATKLRLTVAIHALKTSHVHEDDEEDVGVGVAVGGEHSCGCGTRAGPTKRGVVGALKEVWREMEACVTGVLDCMEELRYELRGDDDGD